MIRPSLPSHRRKAVDQRQPVKTFPESAREIVDPALAAQPTPLPDQLHRHAQNQNLMHRGGAAAARSPLAAIQPQHGLALAFRDRLPRLPAIDIFARGIDGPRAALGLLPIVLTRPSTLILCLLDLDVRG